MVAEIAAGLNPGVQKYILFLFSLVLFVLLLMYVDIQFAKLVWYWYAIYFVASNTKIINIVQKAEEDNVVTVGQGGSPF